MNAPDRPRHKLLIGKRISTIQYANPTDDAHTEWRTLLIRFTDGTTAQIEAWDAFEVDDEQPSLEVTVDGY